MTAPVGQRRPRVPRGVEAVALALPRSVTWLRHNPPPERAALAGLVVMSLLVLLGGEVLGTALVPPVAQVVPLLGGGLLLGPRTMRMLLVVVLSCLGYALLDLGLAAVRPGALLVVTVTAAVAHEFTRSRQETGLAGSTGDTFLVELRTRLQQQGALPPLPRPWGGDAVLSPAGGAPFAGDFVVSSLTGDGRTLELALVDVSGKGIPMAPRSCRASA